MASYSYARVPSKYYSSASRRGSTIVESTYPRDEVVVNRPRRSAYRSTEYADERPSSAYYPTTSTSTYYPVEPVHYTRTSRAPEYTSTTRPSRESRRTSSSATMLDGGNSYVLYGSKGTRLEVQVDTPSRGASPATSHASSSRSNLSSHTSYDSYNSIRSDDRTSRRAYRNAGREDSYTSTKATCDDEEYGHHRSRYSPNTAFEEYFRQGRDSRVDERLRDRVSRANDEMGRRRPLEPTTSNSSSRWSDKTVRAPTPPSPLANSASRVRWADEDMPSITERLAEMKRKREAKRAAERGAY